LAGLGNGWPKDHTISISREAEQALVSLLEQVPDGTKGELIRLGMLWGSKALEKQASQILARLGQTMKNPRATDAQRIDAARQLVALRPQQSEAVVDVLDTITPQASPELAAGLIEALG